MVVFVFSVPPSMLAELWLTYQVLWPPFSWFPSALPGFPLKLIMHQHFISGNKYLSVSHESISRTVSFWKAKDPAGESTALLSAAGFVSLFKPYLPTTIRSPGLRRGLLLDVHLTLLPIPSVLHDLIWEMGVEITQAWGYPRFEQMVTFHLIPNKLVTPGDTATYPGHVGHLSVRINSNMDHEGRNTWSQRHYKISTQNLNFIFVSIVKHFLFSLN